MKNKTQLSSEEIDKLFAFVKSKYVKYVDLQYELVDHLATAIEEIQEKDHDISFDKALSMTYSKFPVTGFTNFVMQKNIALHRYWLKVILKHLIAYFKVPKIMLLITLAYFTWFAFQYFPHGFVLLGVLILLAVLFIINFKKIVFNRKLNEKYLFLASYDSILFWYFSCIIFYPICCGQFSDLFSISLNSIATIIMSIIISFALVLCYVIMYKIPIVLKEEFNKNYAHLNIKLS